MFLIGQRVFRPVSSRINFIETKEDLIKNSRFKMVNLRWARPE
jgi:hypothetical protein